MADLRTAVETVLPEVRADLERLVRIPSVSADPEAAEHLRASAREVASLLGQAGLPDVRILSVEGGAPAVVARKPGPPGTPTVLLYAHHDVQPAGNREDWSSEPFEPEQRGDRLYGRGAADDKAGIMAHVAALRAFGGEPPVGVTVLVEGEEEVGSPTVEAFLREHRDLLEADVIVIADSTNWQVGVPALTTSLRGLADCVVEVRTLDHAVHSGMYGGPIPDALTALCRLLATLHDEAGDVAVPGLASGPASSVDYPESRFRAESGVLDSVRLTGSGSIADRLWTRPAISVLAVDAPRVAEVSNTLIPLARAAVSMRVPPGQDADAALAALTHHLESHAPWGAKVTVTRGETGQPYAIDAKGPGYDAAREAMREAWGVDPVDIGVGGSIPLIAEFAAVFPEATILVTGVEDPDTRAHGADESLHLGEFAKVCLAEALLLQKLAGR